MNNTMSLQDAEVTSNALLIVFNIEIVLIIISVMILIIAIVVIMYCRYDKRRQSCGNVRDPSYENPQSLNHQNILDNVIELSNNSAYSHVNKVTNDERDYESINDIRGHQSCGNVDTVFNTSYENTQSLIHH